MVLPLYAAALALILVFLSIRTIRQRRRSRVGIGPGGDPELERAMRVHANFCEYVPISLILILFVETQYGSGWWVHALALSLLCGRLLHAFGVSQVKEDFRFRVTGMVLTFTVICVSAIAVIANYVLATG